MKRRSPNLAAILGKVRRASVIVAGEVWPGLGQIADAALPDPMDPVALLPVAAGMACGASLPQLIPVAASVVVMALALRIWDDCADLDNPNALYLAVGPARATNAAAALSAAVVRNLRRLPIPQARRDSLIDDYLCQFLRVCEGQEKDIRGKARTLNDYERVVELKTVAAYRFAAGAGACAATGDPAWIARGVECGAHLGWLTQILDDLEAQGFAGESSDLSYGRFTYPVLIGLSMEHPAARELRSLCVANPIDVDRVRGLLDAMNVRGQLMARALDHRDLALAALGPPLDPAGAGVLKPWLDWKFRDGLTLAGSP